nr:2079_t:CDS:2 [Entrophospora candida]
MKNMKDLSSSVEKSQGMIAEIWQEYGKSDKRWLYSDSTVLSIEILTFLFCGPLSLYVLYLLTISNSTNNSHLHVSRHYWQLILCTCEIYGCYMTFVPEWLTGNKFLVTDNWMYLWIYLGFFNLLWVVVPLLLMIHSYYELIESIENKKDNLKIE